MDALKFAFETLIVGVLAMPCIMLVVLLLLPEQVRLSNVSLFDGIDDKRIGLGALVFAAVYLIGSAVTPLAADFLDDEHWEFAGLPTEHVLRAKVYCEYKDVVGGSAYWLRSGKGGEGYAYQPLQACSAKDAAKIFHLQENTLQVAGVDTSERLKQLHERIVILRGATFSGFVCMLLGAFGLMARRRDRHVIDQLSMVFGWILPAVVTAFAVISLREHFPLKIEDPPIMEVVVILVGLLGFWTRIREPIRHPYSVCLTIASLLTLGSYGGWWWSEVTYDTQVIFSFAALSGQRVTPAPSSQPPHERRSTGNGGPGI